MCIPSVHARGVAIARAIEEEVSLRICDLICTADSLCSVVSDDCVNLS